MRRCFHCGAKAEETALSRVGDGEFCERCFRALLQGDSTNGNSELSLPIAPHQASPPAGASSSIERATANRGAVRSPSKGAQSSSNALHCLVCNLELSQRSAVTFLGGALCPECNGEMVEELRRASSSRPPTGWSAPSSPSAQSSSLSNRAATRAHDETAAMAAALLDETESTRFTPGGETRWCAGCERPMPGPGSYRMLDGKSYCPACIPFYSAHRRRFPPSRGEYRTNDEAQRKVDSECDCCGRPLPARAESIEGFMLCPACLGSDVELALCVAKLRHRRRLTELSAKYDSEKGK
jgi:hypothetical protein